MSEQIREQVSAFLDGELPSAETELLLKRLTRDAELGEGFGRYVLIGEALRSTGPGLLSKGFALRINRAIDGEPMPSAAQPQTAKSPSWWRPLAGVGVAASVAAIAIVGLQQRAGSPNIAQLPSTAFVKVAPGMPVADSSRPSPNASAATLTAQNHEALSYTVPTASGELSSAMAPARLTNYVFAHSKYSSGLGQRGVLADLLIEDDAPPAVVSAPVVPPPPVKHAAQ